LRRSRIAQTSSYANRHQDGGHAHTHGQETVGYAHSHAGTEADAGVDAGVLPWVPAGPNANSDARNSDAVPATSDADHAASSDHHTTSERERLMVLSDTAIAQFARGAGFSGDGLVWSIAVALAESGGNPAARGANGPTDGCPNGSIDRGLWQINTCWHSEWTDAQCYDPATCAKAAFAISTRGTDWTPWSTFQDGSATALLPRARAAAAPPAPKPPPKPAPKPAPGRLIRPLKGSPPITQAFAEVNSFEPTGYLSPEGTIAYQPASYDHYHNGVDYGVACGTPVHAAAAGTIVEAGISSVGFGLRLMIDHGAIGTLYAHLTDITVKVGQKVKQDQIVAHTGGGNGDERDGNSTGCHLHWSVYWYQDGVTVYLPPAAFVYGKGLFD